MTEALPNYTSIAYLSKQRWNSYWYQLYEVTQIPRVKTILEVGIGNTIVSSVLRQMGYVVETLDADANTHPTYVSDVRALTQTVQTTVDLVMCCQTLEHIPYKDVPQVLQNFRQVSNEHLIVTLPYSSIGSYKPRLLLKMLPYIKEFRWLGCFNLFPQPHPYTNPGGHYWEIGKKGYRLNDVLDLFPTNGWAIVKHYPLFENPYHYMIVCKKCM